MDYRETLPRSIVCSQTNRVAKLERRPRRLRPAWCRDSATRQPPRVRGCGSRRPRESLLRARDLSRLDFANSSELSGPRRSDTWKPHARRLIGIRQCQPGHPRACGRSTSGASTKLAHSAKSHGRAIETLPLASGNNSGRSTASNEGSSTPYPCQLAIEASCCDNSRVDKPSRLEPSSESSRSNERRFRRPGIRAPRCHPRRGARHSRATPSTATGAGTRPFGRRKGVVRFSEVERRSGSAIRTRV